MAINLLNKKREQKNRQLLIQKASPSLNAFPHELEGRFLEISCEDTFTDIERILPKYNRIIIMDVSKQHRFSRIYKGKRFGFQINLWKSKPTAFLKEDIVLN